MTNFPIAANDRRAQYSAAASQTIFPYDFPIFADGEIKVYRTRAGTTTLLALAADYAVSGLGAEAGGNVTLTAGALAGDAITIVGAMPNARVTDFQEQGDFRADVINLELDRLQIQIQEMKTNLTRLVGLAEQSAYGGSLALPDPVASSFLRAAADGLSLQWAQVATLGLVGIPVPVSQGGTGQTAAPAAFDALKQAASESYSGVAEIATQAEWDGGVDDLRFGTAKKRAESVLNSGLLFGLAAANNAGDAANDIDFAAGFAAAEGATPFLMRRAAGLTKQLDAAWAAGTNAGMRSSSALSNTTWHLFLIGKADGTTDFLAHDAVSPAAVLPSGYVYYRRVASIVRAGGAIRSFVQIGDQFLWNTSIALDVDVTNPGTSAVTRTLSVPTGIVVEALINILAKATGSNFTVWVSALAQTDYASGGHTSWPLGQVSSDNPGDANALWQVDSVRVMTNTSAQIRSRQDASAAGDVFRIATLGYIDTRGKFS